MTECRQEYIDTEHVCQKCHGEGCHDCGHAGRWVNWTRSYPGGFHSRTTHSGKPAPWCVECILARISCHYQINSPSRVIQTILDSPNPIPKHSSTF